jgi:hypothetical protein
MTESTKPFPSNQWLFLEVQTLEFSGIAQCAIPDAILAGPVTCDALDRAREHERRLLASDLDLSE